MKRTVVLAALCASMLGVGALFAAQPAAGDGMESAIKKQIMAMSRGATAEHKMLDVLVGKFDEVTTIYAGPAPVTVRSASEAKWIMDGRYVQLDSKSAEGEELKGTRMIVYGYDPLAAKYTMFSIDTMGVTAAAATGTYDAASKTFTFEGTREMPGMGPVPYHMTLKVDEAGTITQSITMQLPEQTEVKEMVKTVRTRVK